VIVLAWTALRRFGPARTNSAENRGDSWFSVLAALKNDSIANAPGREIIRREVNRNCELNCLVPFPQNRSNDNWNFGMMVGLSRRSSCARANSASTRLLAP